MSRDNDPLLHNQLDTGENYNFFIITPIRVIDEMVQSSMNVDV